MASQKKGLFYVEKEKKRSHYKHTFFFPAHKNNIFYIEDRVRFSQTQKIFVRIVLDGKVSTNNATRSYFRKLVL